MSNIPDKSIALLLQRLSEQTGHWLIVADENWHTHHWLTINHSDSLPITAISNRMDIARGAEATGINCQFNDFDFSDLPAASFDGVLYRVSKERTTSHHIINQSLRLLKPNATLLLAGEKNDGIKSYVKQAGKLLGDPVNAEKQGKSYIASLRLIEAHTDTLNDKKYPQLRPINLGDDLSLQTKPGIFGWDKIDRGSAFLMEHLAEFLEAYKKTPSSLLDLGCGYGYLALCASRFDFKRIVATDNNAAAIMASGENLKQLEAMNWEVMATDAGDQISEQFDTILCNPPFHSGFAVDDQLSIKFLNNCKRLLAPKGQALFVVNTFIPLEQKAKQYFNSVEVIANNRSFKLVMLGN